LIALDTNVLVYAAAPNDIRLRNHRAVALLGQLGGAGGAIVPLQVIGEFLNVCRRKKLVSIEHAARRANQFLNAFDCPPTIPADLLEGLALSERHNLQFFDALIVTISARAGATVLFSEDMQDGLEVAGLRVLNPFQRANFAEIEALLA
jgi:predicted nucleic acid-binding protein